jgi:hypothetical protein
MNHFYFAADKSRVDKALAENHANILFSAAASWNPKTEKLYVPKNLHGAKRIFIDSGGYTYRKTGEYPFSLEQYIEYIGQFIKEYPDKVVAVATLDYPCTDEPSCDVGENIKKTHMTAIKIIHELNPYPFEFDWYVPIHGKTLDDYMYALELFNGPREEGIYANDDSPDFNPEYEAMLYDHFIYEWLGVSFHIALGSLKRLTEKEIVQVCKTAKEVIPWNLKIHGFGVPLSKLRNPEIAKNIDSADSAAWRYGIVDKEEKITAYHTYDSKINRVLISHKQQTSLCAFF